MIDILIDSMPVYLSDDLTLNITSRNPYLTKEGEFTLDIDISLQVDENRMAYKNIDRINNTINNKSNRAVELFIDGQLILSGTEVLISNTEDSVKIQILAGNSELNYKIRDNVLIRDLDLGTINYTADSAYQLNGMNDIYEFTRGNYCFPLVLINDNGSKSLGNDFSRRWIYSPEDYEGPVQSGNLPEQSNLYPQLYLDFAIEKLIEALGYTISKNIFSIDPLLKYLVMASCNNSEHINKLYPNMTVKDFLTKIEESFSVVINIDNKNRTAVIERLSDFISNSASVCISSTDDFSIEYQDKKNEVKGYQYKRGDTSFHKRMILKEDVITSRPFYEYSDFQAVLSNIQFLGGFQYAYDKNFLFKDSSTNTYFYIAKENTDLILSEVGIFTDFRSVEKKEIECVPVECDWMTIKFAIVEQYTPDTNINMYCPVINKPIVDTNQNLDDVILNGINKEEIRDTVGVFFYNGPKRVDLIGPGGRILPVRYSLAFTDYNSITYRKEGDKWSQINNDPAKQLSLRINKVTSIMEDLINTSEEYKFKLLSRAHINNVFEIKNRLFIAKESVTVITNGVMSVTGTFYPIIKNH